MRVVLLLIALLLPTLPSSIGVAQENSPNPVVATESASTDAIPAPPATPNPIPKMPTPAPMPPAVTQAGPIDDISIKEWDRKDWMLMKPETSLLGLNGYFRIRTDLLRRLDFGNQTSSEAITRYPATSGKNTDPKADYTYANMRLRLEPTINVTQNVHIVTTIDVLDNLILGSTPNAINAGGRTPVNLLSSSQNAPQKDFNAITDSFVIKRAYARITALNEQLELRVGRMPNHWGLGMMANSGDCLDCDSGDVVDRISLSFKIAGHIFQPMFDWVSSGPVYDPFGRSGGQPVDAVTWDDVEQYSIRVQHLDHPDDIKNQVLNGKWVLNYGGWLIWRRQSRDLSRDYYLEDPTDPTSTIAYDPSRTVSTSQSESRKANALTFDAYLRAYWDTLEVSLEGALMWAEFSDRALTPKNQTPGTLAALDKTQVLKWGAALETNYRLKDEYASVMLYFRSGAASGDKAPGFGVGNEADSQRGYFGTNPGKRDARLGNFQFSPEYHLDLLMFRRILGTVTGSWYIQPAISYAFDENFGAKLGFMYAQAMTHRSTPSCADANEIRCRIPGNGEKQAGNKNGAKEMGLEIDAELSYGLLQTDKGGAIRASFAGALLFPFGAFNNPALAQDDQGGSLAWTIQSRLYITF